MLTSNRKKIKMNKTGIVDAVAHAGGQQMLALAIGTTQQNVSSWVSRGWVPIRWIIPVEQATGIPRERLIEPRLIDLVKPKVFD